MTVTLTLEECKALHELIDDLSGGNPEYVFLWDGNDDPTDPQVTSCVKVFTLAGRPIPESLKTKD